MQKPLNLISDLAALVKYRIYISYDMAKKRTIADLIKDEFKQNSLSYIDAYKEADGGVGWVIDSQSGATLKTPAPEQLFVLEQPPIQSAPEQKHWVEIYTGSKRKAYYYYRYVWMEGRKLHHVHISGAASSLKAKSTKQLVEDAIAIGNSPTEIIALIKSVK